MVLVRSVVDCRVPLPAGLYGEGPLPEGMIRIINPSDWFALKRGLDLCVQDPRHGITALSLGDEEAGECLRRCLAAGARKALRIWDEALEGADALGRGRALAAALGRAKPDLVLCGDTCLDQMDSLLPGVAAAAAEMCYVPGVTGLEGVEDGNVTVLRRLEKGRRERVTVRLPALVAMEDGGGDLPCEASLPGLIAALSEPVPCRDLASLGLPAQRCGRMGAKVHPAMVRFPVPLAVRPATPDPGLPAEQRLRAILAGGAVRKKGEVITGTPDQLADQLLRFLNDGPGE